MWNCEHQNCTVLCCGKADVQYTTEHPNSTRLRWQLLAMTHWHLPRYEDYVVHSVVLCCVVLCCCSLTRSGVVHAIVVWGGGDEVQSLTDVGSIQAELQRAQAAQAELARQVPAVVAATSLQPTSLQQQQQAAASGVVGQHREDDDGSGTPGALKVLYAAERGSSSSSLASQLAGLGALRSDLDSVTTAALELSKDMETTSTRAEQVGMCTLFLQTQLDWSQALTCVACCVGQAIARVRVLDATRENAQAVCV